MKAMIHGYENRPGEHCGSTSLRNLIQHYCGLDLSEPVVFGLGSGVDFMMLEHEKYRPATMIFGRSSSLEPYIVEALAIDYREQAEPDDARAWEVVRDEVLAGRPTMLSGDALYLTYRDFKVHFPAHRFVLLGFDDDAEIAFVADRLDVEPQSCSYESLRLSRNPPDFMSTLNLWGKFHGREVGRALPEAFALAIERCALRMLGEGRAGEESPMQGESSIRAVGGLAGLAAFARDLPGWAQRDDVEELASYASSCIEKFGTGGGNFRGLYADFLRAARTVVPHLVDDEAADLMARSASKWTELSLHLWELSKTRQPGLADQAADAAADILELETRLFDTLAEQAVS